MSILMIIVLIAMAMLLIMVEICTPTFGLLGLLSVAALVWAAGIAFGLNQVFGIVLTISMLLLLPLFVVWSARWLPTTGLGRVLALKRDKAKPGEGTPEARDLAGLVGQETVAETVLRPSGTIRLDGRRVVAQAESGFIEKGKAIRVIRAAGAHVVVRAVEDDAEQSV